MEIPNKAYFIAPAIAMSKSSSLLNIQESGSFPGFSGRCKWLDSAIQ